MNIPKIILLAEIWENIAILVFGFRWVKNEILEIRFMIVHTFIPVLYVSYKFQIIWSSCFWYTMMESLKNVFKVLMETMKFWVGKNTYKLLKFL